MQNKSSNSVALWFIPLVAVLLAAFFTIVFLVGKALYNRMNKPSALPVQTAQAPQPAPPAVPVVPFVELEDPDEPALPPEVEIPQEEAEIPPVPEVCPATAVPLKLDKPKRRRPDTAFEQGLKACAAGGTFPCAWEDNSQGVIKQYWLMSAAGPVQRGVYDRDGNLIHETIATLSGTVTSYTEQNKTYFFEGGVLTKIRTSPYENCNFHDWFFIDAADKLDVCQCAYTTGSACCERSPYKEGDPRGYCDLNPLDKDFCK